MLGVVPIAKDGSFYVEVPANTAFRFELVDIDGKTLIHETEFNYTRPGERKGCIGCHEPKGAAVPEADVIAMRRAPYPAIRKQGDLIYEGRERHSFNTIVRE